MVAFAVDIPDVESVRDWLDGAQPVSWLLLVLGLAFGLMSPVPRSALSVLVGAVTGFPSGLVVVIIGSLLGGLGGYAISRSLGRAAVEGLAGPRLRGMEQALSRCSLVAVLVARVMPMLPFMVVSYAAGLIGVRLAPFVVGTAIGALPGSVVYVALGASLGSVDRWVDLIPIGAWVLSLLAGTGGAVVVGRRQMRRRRQTATNST